MATQGSTTADLFRNVDDAILNFIGSASSGLVTYVMPIAWVTLAVLVLCFGFLTAIGKVQAPVTELIKKFFFCVILLWLIQAGYKTYVIEPALALPQELIIASSGSPSALGILGHLQDQIEQLIGAFISIGLSKLLTGNVGQAILVMICGALSAMAVIALCVVAAYNLLYAKVGLALVLATGPIFLFVLLIPQVRGWFYSWLNTVFYFVVLGVISSLCVQLFVNIVITFLDKIGNIQTNGSELFNGLLVLINGSGDALSLLIQIVLVTVPLTFLFIQVPSVTSSLTSGAGGSPAGGLTSLFHVARSLMGDKSGGGKAESSSPGQPHAPPAPAQQDLSGR